MKKILAAALAILMIFSMASMMVFNAEGEPQVKVSASYVINEDTVVATVSIDNTTDKAVAGLNVTLTFDTDTLEFASRKNGSFTNNNGKTKFANISLAVGSADASSFNMTLADANVGDYDDSDPEDIIDKRDLGKGKGDIAIVTFNIKDGAAITACPFTLAGKDGNVSIVDINTAAFTASYTVVSPVADYTALEAAIADAEALAEENFIAESWTAVEAALETAKAARTFDAFKQTEVDAAAAALLDAISGLKVSVSWVILDAAAVEEEYDFNAVPAYTGEAPVKAADGDIEYEFAGWTDGTNEYPVGTALPAATAGVVYTAVFEEVLQTTAPIAWDVDGTITSERVDLGTIPEYKGEAPAKASDDLYDYTFIGWTDGTNDYLIGTELPAATARVTYTAKFEGKLKTFAVTWIVDGVETEEDFDINSAPVYNNGETPIKASDDQYDYAFLSWTDGTNNYPAGTALPAITAAITYTAIFESKIKTFSVTWIVDGVETEETYEVNSVPTYKGEAPVKASDGLYNYTFMGWIDGVNNYSVGTELPVVTADVAYMANFGGELIKYNVKWVVDGISTVVAYDINSVPVYNNGVAPVKASDAVYDYTFTGWSDGVTAYGKDEALPIVTGEASYLATFESSLRTFVVTWVINDVGTPETYDVNSVPIYKGETPEKASDALYNYTFVGWTDGITEYYYNIYSDEIGSSEDILPAVTADVTYTAMFVGTLKTFTITWAIEGVETAEIYEINTVPAYTGETPVKASDELYDYTFTGWRDGVKAYGIDEAFPAATGDVLYLATFEGKLKTFNVIWDVEGEQTTTVYNINTVPAYEGEAPVKASDALYNYTFAGWSDGTTEYAADAALPAVTGEAFYLAIFDSKLISFDITWVVDGVESVEAFDINTVPVYNDGEAIVKEDDEMYIYTFTGWTDGTNEYPVGTALPAVTSDATYTATYSKVIKTFSVKWVVDGVSTEEIYDANTVPSYKAGTPVKESNNQYDYLFYSWTDGVNSYDKDTELPAVTADVVYVATFATSPAPRIGDINKSGKITISDAMILFKHIAGVAIISDARSLRLADVNLSGNITIADAMILFKYIAGAIGEL